MKYLLCLSVVILFIQSLGARRFRCDYKHFQEAGGYLKYHEIPASWNDARMRCTLEGSVLASPLTPALKTAMINMANATCFQGMWTGLHSKFSKGDYSTVEGVDLSTIPHNWMKCEPDNRENKESCLVMNSIGEFADANCNETLPFVCYKKTHPGMFMNGCGSPDDAYKLDSRTGKCYKFHTFPRIWSTAYETCKAEGGHLVIINSDVENQIVKELFNKGPMPPDTPNVDKGITFVGFYDWDMHGEFRTIHGQTLKEAGFESWEPSQPSGNQYCGGMFKSGRYDDSHCNTRATFICEKDPNSLMCDDEK